MQLSTSKRSFMPRAGLAYRWNDKTAIRIGYARFVIPVVQTQPFLSTAIRLYGFTARTPVAPSLEGVPQAQLNDPFPASNPLILPVGKAYGRHTNLGDSATWHAQDFSTGVSERINFSIQRQLWQNFHLDATYFLNLSYNLPYTHQVNMADPNLRYTYKQAVDKSVSNPFYQLLPPDKMPGPLRSRPNVSVASLLTPYPQYGTLSQLLTADPASRYHALQLRVQRPFTKGLSVLWAYNYNREKSEQFFNDIDQYADRFTFIDSNNPRHRMSIAGSWDLPVGRNRAYLPASHPVVNAILGEWSTSWIVMYNSGAFLRFPQAIVSGDPRISNPTRSRYFDTSIFKVPEPYTPRTNPWQYPGVTGPRYANMDASISKFFPIMKERLRLEFKLEAYNLTNSFMATNPVMTVTSSLFGRSTGQANRGREMQYTLRLHF